MFTHQALPACLTSGSPHLLHTRHLASQAGCPEALQVRDSRAIQTPSEHHLEGPGACGGTLRTKQHCARTADSTSEGLNLEGSPQTDALSTCSSSGGVTLGCCGAGLGESSPRTHAHTDVCTHTRAQNQPRPPFARPSYDAQQP